MPLVGKEIRMKEIRLPSSIADNEGRPTSHFTLHYYFEVCQGGDRQYSQLYSEDIVTGSADETDQAVNRVEDPTRQA
jgi:hypothetical protein